jgi:hypothetical protein
LFKKPLKKDIIIFIQKWRADKNLLSLWGGNLSRFENLRNNKLYQPDETADLDQMGQPVNKYHDFCQETTLGDETGPETVDLSREN